MREKYLSGVLMEIETKVKSSDHPYIKYDDFPLLKMKKHAHIETKKNALIKMDRFRMKILSMSFV